MKIMTLFGLVGFVFSGLFVASILLVANFVGADENFCSGKTTGPCAKKVTAKAGCTWYSRNNCQGEVVEAPYTSNLVDGEKTNNLRYSYNFQMCAIRYECTEGTSIDACVRGNQSGISWGQEVYNGGACKVLATESVELE